VKSFSHWPSFPEGRVEHTMTSLTVGPGRWATVGLGSDHHVRTHP
jgi:hypothetical protein